MPESVVTVEIHGLNELVARMSKSPALVRRLAGDAIEKSVHLIHGGVAQYPPPPPDSTYRRTGTLGRRWTTKTDREKLEGRVGNATTYAPYVQDKEKQAAIHQGRWQTAQGVTEGLMGKIEGFFRQANEDLTKALAG